MLLDFKNGQTSVVLRVKLRNSSVSTGAGLTGLTSASTGLVISTIADNEATATAYTVAGGTIESITTLGTFATPTATKCRFKEVDATNHPGIYEVQIADARFAVSSAKSLLVSLSGATNLAQCDVVVPLRSVDPYDAVRFGLTALPNAAAEASGGLVTRGTGTGQLSVSSGQVIVQAGTGTGQLDFTSGVVKANVTQLLGTAWVTPAVAGTPDVNAKQVGGQTASASGAVTFPGTVASPTNITAAAGVALTSAYDFAKGTVAMTEAYAANGVAPTPAQALFAVHQYLMTFGISGTTYTVKKLDGSTTAFVVTLNDATTPTAAARS